MLPKKARIFVSLDALLDTRLAILFNKDPVNTRKLLEDGYKTRRRDEFPSVLSQAEFSDLWNKRDTFVLKDAIMTPVVELCRSVLKEMVTTKSVNYPWLEEIELEVSCYPYSLSEKEMELIRIVVADKTAAMATVLTTKTNPAEMTLGEIGAAYQAMIVYRYDEIIHSKTVSDSIDNQSCPEVVLMAPKLLFNDLPLGKADFTTVMATQEIAASPFIGLKFLSVDTFCVVSR